MLKPTFTPTSLPELFGVGLFSKAEFICLKDKIGIGAVESLRSLYDTGKDLLEKCMVFEWPLLLGKRRNP